MESLFCRGWERISGEEWKLGDGLGGFCYGLWSDDGGLGLGEVMGTERSVCGFGVYIVS